MNIKTATLDELQERRAEIAAEAEQPEADLDALETEIRAINAELEARRAAEAAQAEKRRAVAAGAGREIRKMQEEEEGMSEKQIRNSGEYIAAYAQYLKTGDDKECRALLTTNVATGTVPVPEYIEGYVRTAWERNRIMDMVRKTYMPGNLKIGFEISATDAAIHTEGTAAPPEETLTLGVVNMVPQSIKKWITISDEAIDMGGEEFLRYVYDELTQKIAKKAADNLIALITQSPAASTPTAPGQATISSAPALNTVAEAVANLSDEAENPVIVMNKLTYAGFRALQLNASYAADPFDGLEVLFNNSLPAYSAAEADAAYMVVGDFGIGAHVNFPRADEIRIKYDDLSRAEEDVVKLVGRQYVALGVVAPNAFTIVTKPSA